MMLGLGCDLCDVARIERALERPRFLERVYTPAERARIARRGSETAAGLFAAKEAVSKALGTGIGEVGWKDIEILVDARGMPFVRLSENARRAMQPSGGAARVFVTITHVRSVAAATAAVEGEPAGQAQAPEKPLAGEEA